MEPSARADQRRHDQVDVVVGFGGAGACAALEAAKNGAAVIALDRFQGGGATAASGAIIYAGGGTPYHKAAGFDDRPKEMYQYSKLEVGRPQLMLRCAVSARSQQAVSLGLRRRGCPLKHRSALSRPRILPMHLPLLFWI